MSRAVTNPRRAALAAFLSAGRHITSKAPHQPLTVTAMARIIGVAPCGVGSGVTITISTGIIGRASWNAGEPRRMRKLIC